MADSSDKSKKPKEALNLIDDDANKKLSRRERQRIEEASKVKSVDEQKKEALDIFEDEDTKKKTSVIKKTGGLKRQMPTISKLLDNTDEFASVSYTHLTLPTKA